MKRLAVLVAMIVAHPAFADLAGPGFSLRRYDRPGIAQTGFAGNSIFFALMTGGIACLAGAAAQFMDARKLSDAALKSAKRSTGIGLLLFALTIMVAPYIMAGSVEAAGMLLVTGVGQLVFFLRRAKRLRKEAADKKP